MQPLCLLCIYHSTETRGFGPLGIIHLELAVFASDTNQTADRVSRVANTND